MRPSIPLNQCMLYKCRSKKSLARCLLLDLRQLQRRSEWIQYRVHTEQKASDGSRVIYAPADELKSVQKVIKSRLHRIEVPSWVYSGVKGRCHIDNAKHHAGSRYFVLSDISSFYENCTRDAVYRFFRDDLLCSPDVASLLADLTTVRNAEGKTVIPTGSPCSQLIAYFSYKAMFYEVASIANRYGCKFSLYVDDLTISSELPISNPNNLMKQLAKSLRAYGHRVKWAKTGYFGKDQFKLVTGVAIDSHGGLNVPNHLGEAVVTGLKETLAGDRSEIAPTLGRIGAARQIDGRVFPEAKRLIENAQRRF